MPITRVQSKSNTTNTASTAVTMTSTPQSGNFGLAFVSSNKLASSVGMPANWVLIAVLSFDQTAAPIHSLTVWKKSFAGGESSTITATSTLATSLQLVVIEYSGLAADSPTTGLGPFDWKAAHSSGANNVQTIDCGTVIGTRADNELWIAVVGSTANIATGLTWTNGFSTVEANNRIAVGEKIVSAKGDADTVPTWTNAGSSIGVMCTFADTQLEPQFSGWGLRV